MSTAGDVPEQEGDPTPVASSAVQPDVAALYDRYADAMHASARKVLSPNSMDSDVGDAVSTVMKNLQVAHSRGQLENKDNWESYLALVGTQRGAGHRASPPRNRLARGDR